MPTPYLSFLVPTAGLAAYYPLDNDAANATTVIDESGNSQSLTFELGPGAQRPIITLDQLNGRSGVVFNSGTNKPFIAASPVTPLREILAVIKVAGASFAGHDYGFITDTDDTGAAALLGTSGTTKWGNAGIFANYFKSNTGYITSNMQAPFTNFERIDCIYASGVDLAHGLQFGQDREDGAKNFLGTFCDVLIYTSYLSTNLRRRVWLYYDLKFNLWSLNSYEMEFPEPNITGIHYSYFYAVPEFKGRSETTGRHEYADAGASYNRNTDTPPREWEVSFDCVGSSHAECKLQTDVFDAFAYAVGTDATFSFTDKYGTVHTGVRIQENGYSRTHRDNKSWYSKVDFKLKKEAS